MKQPSTTIRTPKTVKPQKVAVDEYGMTVDNWTRLRAKTDAEIIAACESDPDAMPRKAWGPARRVSIAKRARWKLGMSQPEFASAFRIPLGTLRDWEQHRTLPDQAAQAYLAVIAAEPDMVRKVLANETTVEKPAEVPESQSNR